MLQITALAVKSVFPWQHEYDLTEHILRSVLVHTGTETEVTSCGAVNESNIRFPQEIPSRKRSIAAPIIENMKLLII